MDKLMGFLFLSFLATTYSETTDPSIPSPTFELYCDKHCPCTVGKPKFIEFPHESCQIRNLTGHYFLPCYKILNHSQDRIEVFVKFRGEADGHVRLTDTNDKGFDIIIGSFTNKRTEIRRNYIDETDLRTKHIIETPGVLSSKEFRSFLIRYDKNTTKIELLMEGKSEPLLTWVDWKDHFDLRYVSFSGYNSQLKLEVAFNCTIKDETSVIYELKSLNYTDHQIYYNNGREIYISKKNILLESNLTQEAEAVESSEESELDCDRHCSCRKWASAFSSESTEYESDVEEFPHETCHVRHLFGTSYWPCYKIAKYTQDKIEVFIKFRGNSDGHVILEDKSGRGYDVTIGSHGNNKSEIRRTYSDATASYTKHLKLTPGVLSPEEFRSFLIRYDKNTTKVELWMEGKSEPLLSWEDWEEHFDLRYVRFSGHRNASKLDVAFNCTAKDKSSIIYKLKSYKSTFNNSDVPCGIHQSNNSDLGMIFNIDIDSLKVT